MHAGQHQHEPRAAARHIAVNAEFGIRPLPRGSSKVRLLPDQR
jgi:hypothetical protein